MPTGRPGPAPIHVDRLLATATTEFARCGYAATTMQAVAKAARVTKPTLYARFADKAVLYDACLAREADLALEYLFTEYERAENLAGADEGAANVQALFDYARLRPDAFLLLADTDPSSPASPHRDRLMNAVIDRLVSRIAPAEARAGVDDALLAQITAMSVMVALQAAREALLRPGPDPAVASETAAAYIAGGIRSALAKAAKPGRRDE